MRKILINPKMADLTPENFAKWYKSHDFEKKTGKKADEAHKEVKAQKEKADKAKK